MEAGRAVVGSNGRPRAERGHKADPGVGVAGGLRGEPYSAATIEGRRPCDTSRAPNGVGMAERRRRLAWFRVLAPTSMGSLAMMQVMKGFITCMMCPLGLLAEMQPAPFAKMGIASSNGCDVAQDILHHVRNRQDRQGQSG